MPESTGGVVIFAKLDVTIRGHKRAKRAGQAMGTWMWGLAYCRDQESDGFIPEYMISDCFAGEVQGRKDASKLVDAGLWDVVPVGSGPDGDSGWTMRKYADKNETRAEIDERRAADRVRKKTKKSPESGEASLVIPDVFQADSDRNLSGSGGGFPGSGSGSGSESEDPDPTDRTDQPLWTVGARSIRARERFVEAISVATDGFFALDSSPAHARTLCEVLNARTKGKTTDEALAWLAQTAAQWVTAEKGSSAMGWEPKFFLRWLNGGRKTFSATNKPQGGPNAGTRRILTGNED